MRSTVTAAVELAQDERQRYEGLKIWLNQALDQQRQVNEPLTDFFAEYQVQFYLLCKSPLIFVSDVPNPARPLPRRA